MQKSKVKVKIKSLNSAGFTFVEVILYLGLLAIIMSSIIPYAWNVIQGGQKSAYQQEVVSNARYISERIKYKIRNSFGINSASATQIVLCENSASCATNPTTITYSSVTKNITIQDSGAAAVNLNSNSVSISSFSFTNNTNSGFENISFLMTATTNYTGTRKDYIYTTTLEGAADVRSN